MSASAFADDGALQRQIEYYEARAGIIVAPAPLIAEVNERVNDAFWESHEGVIADVSDAAAKALEGQTTAAAIVVRDAFAGQGGYWTPAMGGTRFQRSRLRCSSRRGWRSPGGWP